MFTAIGAQGAAKKEFAWGPRDIPVVPRQRGSKGALVIESTFGSQGEGRRLEAPSRERKLQVLVCLDKAGNAAIKGLIIDGKLQYEEPLF
ncbi:MAG: hypothetical protein J2P50_03665 [Hyphomicrobiaceae bacterium]|nr:hypothetical protein [Hyphomicrobiaceae bacterium]